MYHPEYVWEQCKRVKENLANNGHDVSGIFCSVSDRNLWIPEKVAEKITDEEKKMIGITPSCDITFKSKGFQAFWF